jgi:hypothetical protein
LITDLGLVGNQFGSKSCLRRFQKTMTRILMCDNRCRDSFLRPLCRI